METDMKVSLRMEKNMDKVKNIREEEGGRD